MPFFIPFIVGAIAAGSIGTGIANEAMDGALFAPEINKYKDEIKVDKATNDRLINDIETLNANYSRDVKNLQSYLDRSTQVMDRFLLAESQAQELATIEIYKDTDLIENDLSEYPMPEKNLMMIEAFVSLGIFQSKYASSYLADLAKGTAVANKATEISQTIASVGKNSRVLKLVKAKSATIVSNHCFGGKKE